MTHSRGSLLLIALASSACKSDPPLPVEAQASDVPSSEGPAAPPLRADERDPAPTRPPPIDPPRASAAASVKAKAADHLGFALDQLAGWYALEGQAVVPSWAATSDARPELARDDDLRTSWTCTPAPERPCALGLSFGEPATVRAIRIYGASGPDWNTYRAHPRVHGVRVHTDAGWVTASFDDGASHGYVVLAAPVETRSIALEILGTHEGKKSQTIHLAELEAYGTSGPARPPLNLDPEAAIVTFETEAWKNKGSSHTIRLAFLEVVRPDGTPQRLLRGTALLGRKGDRFLMIEKLHGSTCDAHQGSYVLLDQRTRMLYPLAAMGGVPGEVLRHDVGEGFAVRAAGDASRPFRAVLLDEGAVVAKWPPKHPQRAEEARVDWGFTAPRGLSRGGARLGSPPEGCAPAEVDAFPNLFEDGQLPQPVQVVACRLDDAHQAVLAADASCGTAWLVAVVDGTGTVVHRVESKEDGRGLRLARIEGVGVLVEATRAAGASSDLLSVAADGITVFEKGAALALRPPSTCDTCDDRFASERVEREDADPATPTGADPVDAESSADDEGVPAPPDDEAPEGTSGLPSL